MASATGSNVKVHEPEANGLRSRISSKVSAQAHRFQAFEADVKILAILHAVDHLEQQKKFDDTGRHGDVFLSS